MERHQACWRNGILSVLGAAALFLAGCGADPEIEGSGAAGDASDSTAASGVGGGHGGATATGGAGGNSDGATSSGPGSGGGGDGSSVACASGPPLAAAALQASVAYLASDELAGRAPGTPGDQSARAYIADRLACLGLTPAGDGGTFQQAFTTTTGEDTANVVGIWPGSDPDLAGEIVVVGSHHDHLGVIDGEIYNGANDNASGSAGVMAIAEALVQHGIAPRRTVAFVTFGAEEHDDGLLGSMHFVASPPAAVPIEKVVYMINLDMIGTHPIAGRVDAFGSFPGSAAAVLLDGLLPDHPDLTVQTDVVSDEGSSDFDAFCQAGVSYLYFETDDEPCWHEPCDDADRIDYPSMSSIATLGFEILLGLADDPASIAGTGGDACGY